MKFKLIIYFMILGSICPALAQDHLYSQFYNAPNYLNPALTGQFEGDFRVNMIYRSQWTSIPGPLNYYTLSADLKVEQLNGGVGLMFTKSSEGSAYLNKLNFAGSYSYSVNFESSALYFGLQAGVTDRKIDADKLIFYDQLGPGGIIPGGSTNASLTQFSNKFYFDAGAGVNAVLGNLMIGAAGQHLNSPNETLTGTTSPLARRYEGYISYIYTFNENFDDSPSLIPSAVLYRQGGMSSFSAGMQYKYKSVNVGLWYRGDGHQNDAISVSLIFDLFSGDGDHKTRLGLSHDATTSRLGYLNTSGTTEGALSYETIIPSRGSYQSKRSDETSGRKCYEFY